MKVTKKETYELTLTPEEIRALKKAVKESNRKNLNDMSSYEKTLMAQLWDAIDSVFTK